jgi:hypothetical protein
MTIWRSTSRFMLVALSAVAARASAADIDLVTHKSFEDCWSAALTTEGYAALLTLVVDGYEACIPASDSQCSASMCNGAPGCPITLRSGSTTYVSTFQGSSRFDSSSGIDPFVMDVVLSGAHCTVTVFDTSNVVSTAQLQVAGYDDGNFGLYMASPLSASNTQVSGLGTSDYSVDGDLLCLSAGLVPASLLGGILSGAVELALPDAEQAALGETVCPAPVQ